MSRTDAHLPYLARAARTGALRPEHDHRDGPCDLPDRHDWLTELKRARHPHLLRQQYRCGWELAAASLEHLCGCAVCTGRYDRERERRRRRKEGRRQALAQMEETRAED